jgi:hypothetical protein
LKCFKATVRLFIHDFAMEGEVDQLVPPLGEGLNNIINVYQDVEEEEEMENRTM